MDTILSVILRILPLGVAAYIYFELYDQAKRRNDLSGRTTWARWTLVLILIGIIAILY